MAKHATTWEGRRALTDSPATTPETYKKGARELMAQGNLAEAAAFFALAKDEEGLAEIADKAVGEGDFFLFQVSGLKLGPGYPAKEKLAALGEAAKAQGKGISAFRAAKYIEEH